MILGVLGKNLEATERKERPINIVEMTMMMMK